MARKPSSSGSPRRTSSRRKPVTIDLEAKTVAKKEVKSDTADPAHENKDTEVKSTEKATASASSKAAQNEKTSQSEGKDETAAANTDRTPEKAEPEKAKQVPGPKKTGSASASSGSGPGKAEAKSEAESSAKPEVKKESKPEAKPAPKSVPKQDPTAKPAPQPSAGAQEKPRSSLPLIAAAAIGGVVTLGGAIGLDRAGMIRLGQEQTVQTEALTELEGSVVALSGSLEGFRSDIETRIGEFSTAAGDSAMLQQQIDSLKAQISEIPSVDTPDLGPLQTRLGELETLMESGGAGVDAGLEALQAKLSTAITRIDALSESLNSLTEGNKARSADVDAGLESIETRLANAIAEVESLSTNLTSLAEGGRARGAGIAAVEERLASRIDAFDSALNELSVRTDLAAARAEAAATADQINAAKEASTAAARKADQAVAIAPVLAAEALQRALETGQPLESALNAFASLGVTDAVLDALQPYAKTGLPTLKHLKSEFDGLAAGFAASSPDEPAKSDAGAVDRLLKGAFGVVKVRPVEPGDTASPVAAAAKVSGALAAGDLDLALDEWQALPDDQKEASQAWADKAAAIQGARRFAETVRTDALARLNITQ